MFNSYKYRFNKKKEDIKSLLERNQFIVNYLKAHKIRKLQLGAGSYAFKDWLNTDLYGDKERNLISLDVTKKFPFRNASIDYIFNEHLIEHFTFLDGQKILNESFRVLKSGGKIRTATPNLEFLINLYKNNKSSLQKKYIKWATDVAIKDVEVYEDTFVINNFVRAWGHQFIYDLKTLKYALHKVGFTNIKEFRPGISKDEHLKNLESHGVFIGQDFNNLESMVLEATKPHS